MRYPPPTITFHPYQERWLADKSRVKIGVWARQTGKTFACSAEAVQDCLQAERQGRKATWIILATSEQQAKESIETAVAPMVRAYFAVLPTAHRAGWGRSGQVRRVCAPRNTICWRVENYGASC